MALRILVDDKSWWVEDAAGQVLLMYRGGMSVPDIRRTLSLVFGSYTEL